MEIIEHGKTYKIFTCTYCGCVFAACKKRFLLERVFAVQMREMPRV